MLHATLYETAAPMISSLYVLHATLHETAARMMSSLYVLHATLHETAARMMSSLYVTRCRYLQLVVTHEIIGRSACLKEFLLQQQVSLHSLT